MVFHDCPVSPSHPVCIGGPFAHSTSERSDREGVNHGYWESDCLGLNQPWASLEAQLEKKLPAMQETWVQSLGWEKSPGEGNGYPLQYSGLENPRDYVVHALAKSRT